MSDDSLLRNTGTLFLIGNGLIDGFGEIANSGIITGGGCGSGTILDTDSGQCVIDPAITQELEEKDDLIADLEAALAAALAEIQSLLDILSSGEITICHNGDKTKTISLAAFGTHVVHGDTRGPC